MSSSNPSSDKDVDWHVQTFASLESTQSFLKDLLRTEKLIEGTVIQSLVQTKGLGRRGGEWDSPMGNLYMSFLLRPDCGFQDAAQLSFVIALAIRGALSEVLKDQKDVQLKWPNDILIEGKKIAGILIEADTDKNNQLNGIIVGTGINIMFATIENAAFLKEYDCAMPGDDRPVAIHPFRDLVLKHVSAQYRNWQEKGFADIRKQWLSHGYGMGEKITANLQNGAQSGIFDDIDDNGALILKQEDGKKIAIHAADVYFDQAANKK